MRALTDHIGDVQTIPDVVATLGAIRDAAAEDLVRPEIDGISVFSGLYTNITRAVLDTIKGGKPDRRFGDPDFVTRLDLELARRYLAAIRAHEAGSPDTPACWAVLFDRRRDQDVRHTAFAAVGVNAAVNFDLPLALLETWKEFPPSPERRSDCDRMKDIFAEEMDDMREDVGAVPGFDSFLPGSDGLADRFGDFASDLLLRGNRDAAWNAAESVWGQYDASEAGGGRRYREEYEEELEQLDRSAHLVGTMLVDAPRLP